MARKKVVGFYLRDILDQLIAKLFFHNQYATPVVWCDLTYKYETRVTCT